MTLSAITSNVSYAANTAVTAGFTAASAVVSVALKALTGLVALMTSKYVIGAAVVVAAAYALNHYTKPEAIVNENDKAPVVPAESEPATAATDAPAPAAAPAPKTGWFSRAPASAPAPAPQAPAEQKTA